MAAGAWAPGYWLLVRERAALAPAVAARPGVRWDGRFQVDGDVCGTDLDGCSLGALGEDGSVLVSRNRLPRAVACTLPALRRDGRVVSIPHLNVNIGRERSTIVWHPIAPTACALFAPAMRQCYGEGCE